MGYTSTMANTRKDSSQGPSQNPIPSHSPSNPYHPIPNRHPSRNGRLASLRRAKQESRIR